MRSIFVRRVIILGLCRGVTVYRIVNQISLLLLLLLFLLKIRWNVITILFRVKLKKKRRNEKPMFGFGRICVARIYNNKGRDRA